MKKIIAIIMCLALVISLAACSNNNGGDVDATVTPDAEVVDSTNETKDEPVAKTLSRGSIDGDVYTNDFIDITFTKPADWTYLSDAEMAETLNAGQKIMDISALEMALSKTATIYDMSASNADGNSIMVCYENTMLTALREVTAEEYAGYLEDGLKKVEGYTYERVSSEQISLGNAEFTKLLYSVTVDGVEITQAYYIKTVGKYAISVIATSTNIDIPTMEAMFS